MQFKVPQFLDIEDKIFGPFTFRQFIYLAGGAGLCYILFKLMGFFLSLIPILIVGGFALALAFYRPNDKPFINMLEAGFKYFFQSKLYIWERRKIKKETKKLERIDSTRDDLSTQISKNIDGNKLRDLAWSLDVLDINKHSLEKRQKVVYNE